MEVLSKKLQYDFNSVQLVAYIPDGLIQESSHKVVGMDYHSDDEQYLSGNNMELLSEIAVATLNIFTLADDHNWKFSVCPKKHPHLIDCETSFPHGDVYFQPPGTTC